MVRPCAGSTVGYPVAPKPASGYQVYDPTTQRTATAVYHGTATRGGRDVNVYVTDAILPMLWHLTPDQVAAGSGTARGIPVTPEISIHGDYNLTGIVALTDHRLVVGHQDPDRRRSLGAHGRPLRWQGSVARTDQPPRSLRATSSGRVGRASCWTRRPKSRLTSSPPGQNRADHCAQASIRQHAVCS